MNSVSGPALWNSTWRKLPFVVIGLVLAGLAQAGIELKGDLVQGGMLVGSGAKGAQVWQDGKKVTVDRDGVFLVGFGRDAPLKSTLKIVHADGHEETRQLKINKREYRIQRIDGLPPGKVTPRSKEDLKRIRDDVVQLKKARARNDARADFLSGFMWPVEGPISGVYGSQRILNGKPRRPHFGVDIARPTGTPVVAPADGVITLTHPDMFFSGGTIIIDHGQQLTSAFLHLSKILVEEGQVVKKGETVAEIGATGRVTGPHLDWRMNLREHRIDPQLLVPPMPIAKK